MKSPRPVLPKVPAGCSTNAARIEPLLGAAEHGVVRSVARRVARAILADARAERRVPQRARPVALHEDGQRLAAAHGPDAREPASRCRSAPARPSASARTAGRHVKFRTQLCRVSKSDRPLL